MASTIVLITSEMWYQPSLSSTFDVFFSLKSRKERDMSIDRDALF